VGCKKTNPNAPVEVTGKVTYNGKDVTGGIIKFHSDQIGGVNQASIHPDGTYTVTDLPTGKYVVTVETESINPNKKMPTYGGERDKGGGMSPVPKEMEGKTGGNVKYVKIPGKFGDKTSSPLKVELKPGKNTEDFDLKD
jgi:hypothetical protein